MAEPAPDVQEPIDDLLGAHTALADAVDALMAAQEDMADATDALMEALGLGSVEAPPPA